MSASVDAELHAMTRFLMDAAYAVSALEPKDDHFYEEFSRSVDAIIFELAGTRARVRQTLPEEATR